MTTNLSTWISFLLRREQKLFGKFDPRWGRQHPRVQFNIYVSHAWINPKKKMSRTKKIILNRRRTATYQLNGTRNLVDLIGLQINSVAVVPSPPSASAAVARGVFFFFVELNFALCNCRAQKKESET